MITARIYTRTATINNSDPENPVVTWSPWQSVATPNNLESVDVQVDPPGQPSGTYLVFVYSTTSGTDTLYVNLSQLMPVYTSGNGAIDISTDYRVSLRIDPSSMGASVSDSGLKITGQTGTVIYGEIRLLPFRPADLVTAAPGWYFCNGDNYALSSAQGTALNALSANFKSDWGVTISGSNISLPNLFYSDGRGLFLRSVNGSTRQVGSVEDDQMRPITGEAGDGSSYGLFSLTAATGAFKVIASGNHTPNGSVFPSFRLGLDSSLLGTNYNGADTHPLNTGMTPAIFLGV